MKDTIKKRTLSSVLQSEGYRKELESARLRVRLGAVVYSVREKMNLTQSDLAKRAGTSQKMVSKIENGDVNLGLELLYRVASSLNFSQGEWAAVWGFCPEYVYNWQMPDHGDTTMKSIQGNQEIRYISSLS